VLACSGLGDDAFFAHAPRQQDLTHGVVDLVCAGMVELVALEIDLCPAEMLGQPRCVIERTGPPDIMLEKIVEFGLKGRVGAGCVIGLLDLKNQRHQRFGDIATAKQAEMAVLVGQRAEAVGPVAGRRAGVCWVHGGGVYRERADVSAITRPKRLQEMRLSARRP
jgi:hypothetical protein